MREILFRGKRIDNGEWVYGDLTRHRVGRAHIRSWENLQFNPAYNAYEVDPETVGQFIGMKDRLGKKIFEGDVLEEKIRTRPGKDGSPKYRTRKYIVRYDAWTFHLEGIGARGRPSRCMHNLYAIANIHDNPEFLEVPHE